jgi:hypothetical protein
LRMEVKAGTWEVSVPTMPTRIWAEARAAKREKRRVSLYIIFRQF